MHDVNVEVKKGPPQNWWREEVVLHEVVRLWAKLCEEPTSGIAEDMQGTCCTGRGVQEIWNWSSM